MEDYDLVLDKGPWFIGEHFLSIRPWIPNFRSCSADVSSIAVWVRLTELPIEYYQVEALKEIGSTIGKVLRIDTHTALEARGRYAQICVQINVEKPLILCCLLGISNSPLSTKESINYVSPMVGLDTGRKFTLTLSDQFSRQLKRKRREWKRIREAHTKGMLLSRLRITNQVLVRMRTTSMDLG